MSVIKSFIIKIIYVAIVTIIVDLIIPKGNTKKYIYVALSLFVLLNVISPIVDVINNTNMKDVFNNVLETVSTNAEADSYDINEFTSFKDDKVKEDLESKMLLDISEKMKTENIEFKNVSVTLSDDYDISSVKITISYIDENKEKKAEKISDVITKIAKEYSIDENKIKIIEEGAE